MLDVVYVRNRNRIRTQGRRGYPAYELSDFFSEGNVLHDMLKQELKLIEWQIDQINDQYARIKQDLESLYCTLRCENKPYQSQDADEQQDLIALSCRADVCIGEVYALQTRRNTLLNLIDQSM